MKTKKQTLTLAALSALNNQPTDCAITALSAEMSLTDDGWYQLLPAGFFKAVDGRPTDVASGQWFIDASVVQTLKANTPHQDTDLVIDYEHQTLNSKNNGQPAPAAGYFSLSDSELEWREGQGLYVKPRFNDKAQAFINAKEYRYLSCVFGYDKQTGTPQFIHSAALTNRPGVDGLTPLAELSAQLFKTQPKETAMNKLLIDMLAKLGIDLPDANNVTPEQSTAALSALANLQADAGKVEGLNTQIVALTDGGAGVDLSKFVPVETYNALNTEFAALSAQSGTAKVESLVQQAFDEGKIRKSEMGYLTDLGNQNGVAALTASLDVRVPIAALNATQTDGKAPKSKDDGLAQLSAEDKTAANLLGISHADFAKQKEGEK